MKRILIGYDSSSCAEEALADLRRAGLPTKLEATVLSVADVWLPANSPPPGSKAAAELPLGVQGPLEAAWRAVHQESHGLAEHAAEVLRKHFPEWRVESLALGDSPAWAIVTKAAEWQADLIVVGSHGRSMMKRFFLGSVSHKVAIEARCSVRIARLRHPSDQHHIVLALDGSPDSLAAMRVIASRVWSPSATFEIVTAMDSRLLTAPAWASLATEPWVLPTDTSGKEWVGRALESCAQQLHRAGLTAEIRLLEGDPKHLLLQEAENWEADCIFLGAHGLHHGLCRSLGSLASAVATRAHCSVEIVREKPMEAKVQEQYQI